MHCHCGRVLAGAGLWPRQPLVEPIKPPPPSCRSPNLDISPHGGQSTNTEVGQDATTVPVHPVTTTVMALSNDPNYKKLEEWYKANADSLNMRDMFAAEPDRFIRFRLEEKLFTSV